MPAVLGVVLVLGGAACSREPSPSGSPRLPSRPGLFECDGCEVAAERSPAALDWRVRLPPPGEPGEPLVLTGQVVEPDGRTPAAGVVLYLHHTNAEGRYRSARSTAGGGRGDGIIEGWLATDAAGRYRVDTILPAPYPDAELPAHIHIYVREPGRRPYYIDDVVFAGRPHVTEAYRAAQEMRGGPGIVRLVPEPAGGWRARRDITLEP